MFSEPTNSKMLAISCSRGVFRASNEIARQPITVVDFRNVALLVQRNARDSGNVRTKNQA